MGHDIFPASSIIVSNHMLWTCVNDCTRSPALLDRGVHALPYLSCLWLMPATRCRPCWFPV